MGTRALIRIEGKDFLATHWDGNPECLGKELSEINDEKNIEEILTVAMGHTIDCADKSVLAQLNELRMISIAKRQNLPLAKVKKGVRRGSIIGAGDYGIGDIKRYGDFAEYIYDIKGDEVFVAEGDGAYSSKANFVWKKMPKNGKSPFAEEGE
jgi:hypothetical protein